ncbi:MAG: hypothetical protein GXP55_01825 [Deltaproteobacteria bacterium]|nr:hypothetical protein [Deltaproteobacteria bacterium]
MEPQLLASRPEFPYDVDHWFDPINTPIGVRCIFDDKPDPLAMWETMTIVQDGTPSTP